MSRKLKLLRKSYDGESICDVHRDFAEAFDARFTEQLKQIPVDEYGFQQGTFTVTVVWRPE